MSALAGGPGTELLGTLKHCMEKRRQTVLRCNLFDRQQAWAEAWADVDKKIDRYSDISLEAGDQWRQEMERALKDAKVFVPLITDNYVNSPHCMAELAGFWERMETDEVQLLFIPIFAESSEKSGTTKQSGASLVNFNT
jgi:hypothetical protein